MGLLNAFKKTPKPATEKVAVAPVAAKPAAVKATKKVAAQPELKLAQHSVLLKPVVTEKSTVTGTYCFRVSPDATKNEIKKAFKAYYGKMPRKVNILNVIGKTKLRGKVPGKRADWKKAIVYLTKGETVDLYQ